MSPAPPDAAQVGADTVRWERLRALGTGPFGSTGTIALVAAVSHFHAAPLAKSLLASLPNAGFLLAPFLMALAAGRSVPARWWAGLLLVAAAGLGLAACGSLDLLIIGYGLAGMVVAAAAPLGTALWRLNLPQGRRGREFAGVVQREVVAGLTVTGLAALWMGDDAGRHPLVLIALAVLLSWSAWCLTRIPARPLPARRQQGNPLAVLAWLWRDPTFGMVCLSWSVMGFASFLAMPLRAEYLGNPVHGLAYRPDVILVLLIVVPQVARLVALPLWGRLFDRVPFLRLRAGINLVAGAGIALFFLPWLPAQIAGSVLTGCAFAGGDIAWSLWTTTMAPPGRAEEYSSAHVFLTGVRGIIAPLLAFPLAGMWGPHAVAWVAVGLMLAATGLIVACERGPGKAPA